MNADESYKSIAAYVDASRARIAELEAELDAQNDEFMQSLAEKYAEIDRLQSHDKEAMELLEAALKEVMAAADDNGGCYGCVYLDVDEKCTSEQGREMCDCKTNNMWRWQHADRYEALKARQNETRGGDKL